MNACLSRFGVLVGVSIVLAGCATTNPPTDTSKAPASQTPVAGDARSRARIHTELAGLYYQGGNMAVALEEVRTALSADSGYAPAYNLRGLIHSYLREFRAADESFRQALVLAPGDPEVSNSYGQFLCQSGRSSEAFEYFATAIKNPLYQTPENAYVNAGICALEIGDLNAAEDYLLKATRRERGEAAALLPLAKVQYRRGRFEDTRRSIEQLHRLVEPTAESLWLAVRVERHLGDRIAETSLTAQLRRRFPDSREAQDMKRGKYD